MQWVKQTVLDLLEKPGKIAVFGHVNPDGDCIWSLLAFKKIFEKLWREVDCFAPGEISSAFDFVKWIEDIQSIFNHSNEYKFLVFVDFSTYDRIREFTQWHEDYFNESYLAVIDHHRWLYPESANLVVKDSDASSCCEIIFELNQQLHPELMDEEIATLLYMGLTTDTGNFEYEIDSKRTFTNALKLIEYGADKKTILNNIFNNHSIESMKFAGVLLNRMKEEWHILYTYFTMDEIKEVGIDKEAADFGFNNIIRKVNWPKIYMRFYKEDSIIRWSFRGRGDVNCAELSDKLFGWWGHFNAAGFRVKLEWDFETQVKEMINLVNNEIDL